MSSIPVDDPKFDHSHWTHDYINKVKGATTLMPADWQKLLIANAVDWPPFDTTPGTECDDIKALEKERPNPPDAIILQAGSYEDALWPVQRVLGSTDLPKPKLATKMLVATLAGALEPVIFYVKETSMRRRPAYTCTNSLVPMFGRWDDKPLDDLHPGHPSYPSGHATMAYALAFLYQALHNMRKFAGVKDPADFITAAETVARNRVIAGVHFPTDSEAGKLLARLVVGWLLDSVNNRNADTFRAIAILARTEWP